MLRQERRPSEDVRALIGRLLLHRLTGPLGGESGGETWVGRRARG